MRILFVCVLSLLQAVVPFYRGIGRHRTDCSKFRKFSIQAAKSISVQPLVTDLPQARVAVASDRYIVPGDYVVHEKYGVGLFVGIKSINITPFQPISTGTFVPALVIRYKEGEITWFQKFVANELWVYRTAESGEQELSSLIDTKKWTKRKKDVEDKSKSLAITLVNRMMIRNKVHRTPYVGNSHEYEQFEKRFAYSPTVDQQTCIDAIARDMVECDRPMDRLVCGDVGFGKTEVAMRAIYRAVLSGKQVAVLAPTRILAKQHERTLKDRMPDVNVQLLRGGGASGALKVKKDINSGFCQVAIGTHALLQSSVQFVRLGLLVVDEEQRFGVGHKELLRGVATTTTTTTNTFSNTNTTTTAAEAEGAGDKEEEDEEGAPLVDVLTLSATPIPRTLQLSLSGMRDFSVMRSPPLGRLEVKVTVGHMPSSLASWYSDCDTDSDFHFLLSGDRDNSQSPGTSSVGVSGAVNAATVAQRQEDGDGNDHGDGGDSADVAIRAAIERELERGGQVFVVVPFIRDVPGVRERLLALLPGLRVIEAHGQHEDLEVRVDQFLAKEADVLISTTVIENGIDMPNVNTIIVLSAERFGVSTLYQLKGRVGRSKRQAYAYYFTCGTAVATEAEQRLQYLKTFTALGSGYDLSRRDMEMRGHGTLFGSAQSGAQDIGLDLEAKILAAAVHSAKQDLAAVVASTPTTTAPNADDTVSSTGTFQKV